VALELGTRGVRPPAQVSGFGRGARSVILAVPDVALAPVLAEVVPQLESGSIVLTLDPAAAYANLLYQRDDVEYAVAHPCHPWCSCNARPRPS
jgi:hypothetical protein